MDDVLPETRGEVHAAEVRALRWKMLRRLPFFVAALALWVQYGPTATNPVFLFVGLTALATGGAVVGWWRHRREDPALAEARVTRERARAEEVAAVQRHLNSTRWPLTLGALVVLAAVGVEEVRMGSINRVVAAVGLLKPTSTAEWWRTVTAAYVHGSLLHFGMNAGALIALGRFAEGFLPRWRLPLVLVVSGVAGSLASLWLAPQASLGASGAIMGIAGYLAVVSYRDPRVLPTSVRSNVLTTIGLTAWIGAFGVALIDNAAHGGGLVAGAVLGWWLTPLDRRPWLDGVGVVALALLIAGGAFSIFAMERAIGLRERPVTSASVLLLRGSGGAMAARIENHSDMPLEAFRLEVRAGRTLVETAWRDDCCFEPVSHLTPIPPHASRDVPLKPFGIRTRGATPVLKMTLAMFGDGSYQGDVEYFEAMSNQRRAVLDEADYWLDAIEALKAEAPDARWHALNNMSAARMKRSRYGSPAIAALGIGALGDAIRAPSDQFAPVADRVGSDIRAICDGLRSVLRRASATTKDDERRTKNEERSAFER